jgi:hypothetical protein
MSVNYCRNRLIKSAPDREVRDAGRGGEADLCQEREQGHVAARLPRRTNTAGGPGRTTHKKLPPGNWISGLTFLGSILRIWDRCYEFYNTFAKK